MTYGKLGGGSLPFGYNTKVRIVFNNERQIVYEYLPYGTENIFSVDAYDFKNSTEFDDYFEFIFTPEMYEAAEPIEPEEP